MKSSGAMRDMVQNHLMQLLCLIAMEPPSQFEPDAVRDEKLKVIRALDTMLRRIILCVGSILRRMVRTSYREDVGKSTLQNREFYRSEVPGERTGGGRGRHFICALARC